MKCLCHFPSLLQDDSEVAPKISGCSTPRLLASGPLEEISSISLIAEGIVVKKSCFSNLEHVLWGNNCHTLPIDVENFLS